MPPNLSLILIILITNTASKLTPRESTRNQNQPMELQCLNAPKNYCGAMGQCVRYLSENTCKCGQYFTGKRCQEFDLDKWYSDSGRVWLDGKMLSSVDPTGKSDLELKAELDLLISKLSVTTARVDSYSSTLCLGITYGVVLCLLGFGRVKVRSKYG